MVHKYQKKPVVIEAIQFNGLNHQEIKDFVGDKCEIEYFRKDGHRPRQSSMVALVTIHTLEGDMRADNGDYIIKGIKGEFYPCKPDVFEQTYNLVD